MLLSHTTTISHHTWVEHTFIHYGHKNDNFSRYMHYLWEACLTALWKSNEEWMNFSHLLQLTTWWWFQNILHETIYLILWYFLLLPELKDDYDEVRCWNNTRKPKRRRLCKYLSKNLKWNEMEFATITNWLEIKDTEKFKILFTYEEKMTMNMDLDFGLKMDFSSRIFEYHFHFRFSALLMTSLYTFVWPGKSDFNLLSTRLLSHTSNLIYFHHHEGFFSRCFFNDNFHS